MHRTNSEGGASSTASSQRWRISSAFRKIGSISGSSKDDKNATVCFAFCLCWILVLQLRFLPAFISAPVCFICCVADSSHSAWLGLPYLDCFLFLLLSKPS